MTNNIPLDSNERELTDLEFWKSEFESEKRWADHYLIICQILFQSCDLFIQAMNEPSITMREKSEIFSLFVTNVNECKKKI